MDLMIYGDVLKKHENLKVVQGDKRSRIIKKEIKKHDTIIHLACISNDPSFDLNPLLGKSINLDAFNPLVKIAKENSIERFIYAFSLCLWRKKKKMLMKK